MEKQYNYVDLAVVEVYNTDPSVADHRYVVECPAWKATVGGIVEFGADTCMRFGRIISTITVEKDGEKWNFISQIDGICPCAGVWELVGA